MINRLFTEEKPEFRPVNLCVVCKFRPRCNRFIDIFDHLQEVEVEAFKNYGVNLTLSMKIDECDSYKADEEIMAQIEEQLSIYDFIDEEDEDE